MIALQLTYIMSLAIADVKYECGIALCPWVYDRETSSHNSLQKSASRGAEVLLRNFSVAPGLPSLEKIRRNCVLFPLFSPNFIGFLGSFTHNRIQEMPRMAKFGKT